MSSSESLRVAIIGFGPRGLGALEALVSQAIGRLVHVQVDIYDPYRFLGAGPNFDLDQSDLCLLNIPVRIADYEPPACLAPHIKPFPEWSSDRFGPDDFPSRSYFGAYLHERFQALLQAVPDSFAITVFRSKVVDIQHEQTGWTIITDAKRNGPYEEVLLAQGQPETAQDAQLERWIKHAAEHELDLLPAYPANTLIAAAQGWQGKTVAIRGLGLSTLDVVRMLTKGLGGSFEAGKYIASGNEPHKIIPFALNGKAPSAKPATCALDRKFDLTNAEREACRKALAATEKEQPDAALKMICDALVAPTLRILSNHGSRETEEDVRIWLDVERKDPGAQDGADAVDALMTDIEMAYGRAVPSVGYVIGQVWRKLQDALRYHFNEAQHDVKTAEAIIAFDEGLKRYSYGPPVFAAEELLALLECGIVSLCAVDDPVVILSPEGWQLIEGNDAMSASVMVDAVIPSPAIGGVQDALIVRCLDEGLIRAIDDNMGAYTLPDAQLNGVSGCACTGLSMLGRLTIGSVIAVDSLSDCFGPSAVRWADGVLARLEQGG